jgi:N-acetylmuramoyl-L-alanine amidase
MNEDARKYLIERISCSNNSDPEIERRDMTLSARNLLDEFNKYKSVVNPFAAVCQCRHETSYQGKPWNSELCLKANNLAGIKRGSGWLGGVYSKVSWEQEPSGTKYEKVSEFRKYLTWQEFAADYARKIERDYPACVASVDNIFGYFSGLFRGRLGAWATDLAYLDRMIDQTLALAPEIFGDEGNGWESKLWAALDYAVVRGRLTDQHEGAIRACLNAAIPRKYSVDNTTSEAPPKIVVCIDPGHGGSDPGAIGPGGTREADITLAIAKGLRIELILKGGGVILTRETPARLVDNDRNKDLAARAKVANDNAADLFVSIHCNAATNRTAQGFEVYTTPGQNNSDALATCIYKAWQANVGGVMRADKSDGDPDKEANFAVIKGTRCPSCLVEIAFISNPDDEKRLNNMLWQIKASSALAEGIEAYLLSTRK